MPPDTWFTCEIVAAAGQIRIVVNGKQTADFGETRSGRRARGHIVLQHLDAATQVHFRKIEIKELPPAPPTSKEPFVILARDKRDETRHATLKDAVEKARSGDTIEICGDGPFVTGFINLGKKALAIRAGSRARPVFQAAASFDGINLFQTEGPLVLEGLEIQWQSGRPWAHGLPHYNTLVSFGSFIQLTNCRILTGNIPGMLYVQAATVHLKNCEFLGAAGCAVSWECPNGGQLVMENCVSIGSPGGRLGITRVWKDDMRIQVSGCTFLTPPFLALQLWPTFDGEKGDVKPVRVEAQHNLFGVRNVVALMQVSDPVKDRPQPFAVAERLTRRLIDWKGRDNLYTPDSGYAFSYHEEGSNKFAMHQQPRAVWKDWWGAADEPSLEGRPAFAGGELLKKLQAAGAVALQVDDFRLADGSPGKGKGPDGKDVGVDVDRLGPGEPYERWRKTAEYQEWRKPIEQLAK